MFNKVFIFVMSLFPAMALADQCSYVSKATVLKAMDILQNVNTFIEYCPLCDDFMPIKKTIVSLRYEPIKLQSDTVYEIYINDTPVDLAYTYINGINLGVKLKCSETIIGVPEHLPESFTE